ncbi:SPC19 [Candida theae]|uniref:DASH complex subunit SPC19 n=1 Tax=Candida theae TaxID=1198502 RepID=A0AAD5BH25_9ASCO|nr:SPC19 [Candida theae]KAI5961991.1 SPC19 [Candida theae]
MTQHPPSHHPYNNLQNCNNSIKESIELLRSSNQRLRESTSDSSRLKHILSTKKIFGLVSELDLDDAKQSYSETFTPQVNRRYVKLREEINGLEYKSKELSQELKLAREKLNGYRSGRNEWELNTEELQQDPRYDKQKLKRLKDLQSKRSRLQFNVNLIQS